jgi:hypothetical protein
LARVSPVKAEKSPRPDRRQPTKRADEVWIRRGSPHGSEEILSAREENGVDRQQYGQCGAVATGTPLRAAVLSTQGTPEEWTSPQSTIAAGRPEWKET